MRVSLFGLLAVVVLGGCATTGARGNATPSLPTVVVVPDAAGVSAPSPVDSRQGLSPLLTVVLSRPNECGPGLRKLGGRRLRTCSTELRRQVQVFRDGTWRSVDLPAAAPRNPYPEELHRQWRTCPFREDARLENLPLLFARYEDPDIGPCYVLRPLDADALARLRKPARLAMLDGLHPYIADAIARLVLQADQEGIAVKVISGIRPYTAKVVTSIRKERRDGKMVRVRTKQTKRKQGLHAWGMAVDVNLAHRNDMGSAVQAYLSGAERAAWDRIGSLGEEYGLAWVGRVKVSEIFHFEWHPTLPPNPEGELKSRFNQLKAAGGNARVWERYLRFTANRATAMLHLRDAPTADGGGGSSLVPGAAEPGVREAAGRNLGQPE